MKRFCVVILFSVFVTQLNLSGQWERVEVDQFETVTSIDIFELVAVFFLNEDIGFAAGGELRTHSAYGKVLKTTDGGRYWKHILHSKGSCPFEFVFINDSIGYLRNQNARTGFRYGDLYQTIDRGNNWIMDDRFSKVIDMFFLNDKIGWVVTRDSILKTVDGGKEWSYFSVNGNLHIRSIHFCNEHMGWAVRGDGSILKKRPLQEWEIITPFVTDLPLRKVYFNDINTGWIAGGFYNDDEGFHPILLKTEDGGESWSTIKNVNYLINDLYFKSTQEGWVVGEDENFRGIILETIDGGNNWTVNVDSLSAPLNAIHFKDGYGWTVGGNGLILKMYDSTYTQIPKYHISDNMNNISLQNYPNPFRSSTFISYKLLVVSEIQLYIYDFTGRKITTLIKETQPPGSHEVEWNAEGLKPGVYFCELSTNYSWVVQKMVLLK